LFEPYLRPAVTFEERIEVLEEWLITTAPMDTSNRADERADKRTREGCVSPCDVWRTNRGVRKLRLSQNHSMEDLEQVAGGDFTAMLEAAEAFVDGDYT
jgi:hypothetical protein